ncbi:MAG: T9SS type A sorting domain-containing protein, partial [Ignavibacteriaceae bacterium]|nr:T9SS type A sorting domain-containing protein [Ignavibacteriaceae bacterium]
TNHYLFDWRSSDNTKVLNDYSRAQRYFIYWLDKFGTGVFQKIVQDSQVGLAGLENALTNDGQSISFNQLFINWLIANKLDDVTVNSAYGYATYTGLTKAVSEHTYYNPNITAKDTVANLGAEYISFTSGSNLSITFNASSTSNLVIKAIEEGSGASRVLDVTPNTAFTESAYGSTYTSIHFAVINTSTSSKQVFSYTATGTAPSNETELKWDFTEPTGYYSWTTSDTVCVTFDAVTGGKLDSIKVALRRAGSITGGVWNYTGSAAWPLGKKLAPLTASISTTASLINSSSTYPYTIPYDNWATVNLTSNNISTDNAFAVGFVIGSDPKTPGVMITDYNSQDAYHSYTYMQTSDAVTTPGWYYITSSDTTVAIYLIRVYVSLNSKTTPDTSADTTKTAANYSLEQNYPNPFNAYTTISFYTPIDGRVKITVYNQLGQHVAVITDAEYLLGSHDVKFYSSGLASGIYFYKIEAGGYTQTKKMALVK